ncbi:MAG: hypothetical protein LBF09_00735, partial [Odoribacteraceae bacterium]|nr:hypothetical protein [Odoribacteraceae bacterium]
TVDRAMSSVDRAMSTVDRAMSTVDRAMSTVDRAMSSVDRAMSSVDRAMSAGNRTASGTGYSRSAEMPGTVSPGRESITSITSITRDHVETGCFRASSTRK